MISEHVVLISSSIYKTEQKKISCNDLLLVFSLLLPMEHQNLDNIPLKLLLFIYVCQALVYIVFHVLD